MPYVTSHITHDLTFTGDYRDLKGLGFSFNKLYASNYICYNKGDMWIWKIGRMVEFGHVGAHSGAIFARMLERDFVWNNKQSDDPYRESELVIDLATGMLDYYDRMKHENWQIYQHLPMSERNEQPQQYVRVWVGDDLVADAKTLYDAGFLKLEKREELPHV